MSFVCFTPNPAIDRRLWLGAPLRPGQLHRVQRVQETAGGKGLNVARTLAALGERPLAAGFLAGANGARFRGLLQRDALHGLFRDVDGETRECQIIIDGSSQPTEINDPGPRVTLADWHNLLDDLPEGELIVSGSLPPGIVPAEFAELMRTAALERGAAPIVDTSGQNLIAAIDAGARLVKPNERELLAVTPGATSAVEAAAELHARTGVEVLLTLGSDGAAFFGDHAVHVAAPTVAQGNPVGSGDCLLAAFVWARAGGSDAGEALRLGVAAGAENARAGGGAMITRAGVMAMLEDVPPARELAHHR